MVAGCASSLGSCTATMRSNGAAKIAVPSSTNACPPSHPREEKPNANSVEILIRPRIRRAQPGRPRSESACPSPMQRIGPAQCVLCECARVSAFTRSRRPVWPSSCSPVLSGRWQGRGRRAGFSKSRRDVPIPTEALTACAAWRVRRGWPPSRRHCGTLGGVNISGRRAQAAPRWPHNLKHAAALGRGRRRHRPTFRGQ